MFKTIGIKIQINETNVSFSTFPMWIDTASNQQWIFPCHFPDHGGGLHVTSAHQVGKSERLVLGHSTVRQASGLNPLSNF